jgi:hypothetical protein
MMVPGEHDKQVPSQLVHDLYADIGSDQKVLIDLACSSHNAMWEKNHLLLFQASLEWLTKGTVNGNKQGAALQGRLPKELALAGITEIEAANRFVRDVYLPAHNARFAKPPEIEESAFVVSADPASLAEILCIEEERIVARDNTVAYEKLQLQLPESRVRAHYVKARVKVHEYPDGTLAVFHGPRLLARYDAAGEALNDKTKVAA